MLQDPIARPGCNRLLRSKQRWTSIRNNSECGAILTARSHDPKHGATPANPRQIEHRRLLGETKRLLYMYPATGCLGIDEPLAVRCWLCSSALLSGASKVLRENGNSVIWRKRTLRRVPPVILTAPNFGRRMHGRSRVRRDAMVVRHCR